MDSIYSKDGVGVVTIKVDSCRVVEKREEGIRAQLKLTAVIG